MATQKRLYYAVYSVSIAECGTESFTAVHGVQSATKNTSFNIEPIFEVGQLDTYELREGIPNVAVTINRVLDGYPLAYHLATRTATSPTLAGRSNGRCTVGFATYTDTQNSASGVAMAVCQASGLYVNNLTYNFPVQGNFEESVEFAGNNVTWGDNFTPPTFNGLDEPLAIAGSGGVNWREDFLLGESASTRSKLPRDIPGVSSSGYVPYSTVNQEFAVHLNSIRVSTSLGREEIFELGRRGPYHRFATFPVEVRTDFEVVLQSGDMVQAIEDAEGNTSQRTIVLRTREGTVIDLGSKNRLSSVNETGGDAGQNGGNRTATYSYTNFNYLSVYHPQDPAGFTTF